MDTEHRHLAYQKLQVMTRYANTQGCLQQFILEYFGEKSAPCGRCSNCTDQGNHRISPRQPNKSYRASLGFIHGSVKGCGPGIDGC